MSALYFNLLKGFTFLCKLRTQVHQSTETRSNPLSKRRKKKERKKESERKKLRGKRNGKINLL